MKVNLISQVATQPKAAKNLKTLAVPLKDESQATIKLADDYIECMITKGDKVLGGYGHRAKNGIPIDDVTRIYTDLKENIKEGFDFFKELTTVLFKK